jgi:amino acid adenylation domain-containing protein
LCFVIYTSGSTGRPKGVPVEHRNLTAYLHAFEREFHIQSGDVVLQQASYSFDAFVEEVFPVLVKGGRVVIADENRVKDVGRLWDFILRHGVTVIDCSPRLLNELNKLNSTRPLKYVRTFISGGDVLKSGYIDSLLKSGVVYNTYGPTEATVCASYFRCPGGEERGDFNGVIPIGKPISNYRLYIIDTDNNLQPVGVPGELCISGTGVARGYLNNPELTNEKFLRGGPGGAVFSKSAPPGGRRQKLYKTGDLARWLPDGNVEFLGRNDQQVKVRGYRIEAGEIERCLLRQGMLKEVAVVVKESAAGEKQLCAYFTVNKAVEMTVRELRPFLCRFLPEYMIPAYFIQLEQMPLTSSGKIDRNALVRQKERAVGTGVVYAPAETGLEKKMAALWEEVLETAGIGIDDNFFELGGDSLRAVTLTAKIHKESSREISLVEIFQWPTIRSMAELAGRGEVSVYSRVEAVESKTGYVLSSAQKRLFVLQQLEGIGTSYNISNGVTVDGGLDVGRLESSFRELIGRHEGLRTSFEIREEGPVQVIHAAGAIRFKIEHYDDNLGPVSFIRPFDDLSRAPLLRVGLLKRGPEKHILMVDMHHIVTDGISTAIFVQELFGLYRNMEYPPLRIHYKDFSEWQNRLLASGNMKPREQYWLSRFGGEIPVLHLPLDYVRPGVQVFAGDTIYFEIGGEGTRALRALALNEDASLSMVLFTLYTLLLGRLSGQEDMVIGIPHVGRQHADLESIIGMFVSTLPVRLFPLPAKTFRQLLQEVKVGSLNAIENQDYPLDRLVEKIDINIDRDTGRNPLFDVMFVFHNREMYAEAVTAAEIPGLTILPYPLADKTSKFDLTLEVIERENSLSLSFEYRTGLFKKETIGRFIGYLKEPVLSVTADPGVELRAVEILTRQEKQRLLFDFNDTASGYPAGKSIPQLFVEQVERSPGVTVLVGTKEEVQITYGVLNEKAGRLACFLKEKGVLPDSIVGIMLKRSIEMIIGILGILKAGGAYLPIDPDYPRERIDYMLKDSNAKVLLSEVSEGPEVVTGLTQPAGLAYVIYTSGSTGRPKGVAVRHRSIVNTLYWRKNHYCFDFHDIILQLPSFSFDSSVEDIFTPLISGSRLVMIEGERRLDLGYMSDLIMRQAVTHFLIVPNFYRAFLQEAAAGLKNMKTVTVAGDRFTGELVVEHFNKLPHVRLFNEYGPTENSVCTTVHEFSPGDTRVLIGKPICNTACYMRPDHSDRSYRGIMYFRCRSGRRIYKQPGVNQ